MNQKSVVFLSRNTDQPLYNSWRNYLRHPIIEVNHFGSDWFPPVETGVVISHDVYRPQTYKLFLRLIEKNFPILILADGILEYRNSWKQDHQNRAGIFNPVLGHKLACIGPSQCRFVESWGNQGKCENVGLPRLDDFVVPFRPADAKTKILISTARRPWFSDEDKNLVVQSMMDLKKISKVLEQKGVCKFVWRVTNELCEILDEESREHISVREEIGEVNAVISTPSTLLLEAMKAGRPTAIIDYTGSPAYVQSSWVINHIAQMENIIKELIDPPTPKLKFQEVILKDSLQIDEPAGPKLARLAKKMIEQGIRCEAKGIPLYFAENLLD